MATLLILGRLQSCSHRSVPGTSVFQQVFSLPSGFSLKIDEFTYWGVSLEVLIIFILLNLNSLTLHE